MNILSVNPLNVEIAKEEKIRGGALEIASGDVVLLTGSNGCGKSTIIRILMGDIFDYRGLKYNGSSAIFYKDDKQYRILENQKDMESFRRNVCYISQSDEFESNSLLDCFLSSIDKYDIFDKEKYVFDFILKFAAYESFYLNDSNLTFNIRARRIAKKMSLRVSKLEQSEKKALLLMSMNVKKMSGGQRKLANILTNLIRYEYCSLLIFDEPLNNLDYGNVRAFSNIITRIYKDKPELGILMVTHCRSIPIINKVIEVDSVTKNLKVGKDYKCNSCFGELSKDGFYI